MHTTTAPEYRAMAASARNAGDLTQAARYERKAKFAPPDAGIEWVPEHNPAACAACNAGTRRSTAAAYLVQLRGTPPLAGQSMAIGTLHALGAMVVAR